MSDNEYQSLLAKLMRLHGEITETENRLAAICNGAMYKMVAEKTCDQHSPVDAIPSRPASDTQLDLAMRIASVKAGDFLEPPQALARQRAWVILAEALKPKE